jgi:hypothetical protein
MNKFSVFANFHIDTEERFLRLKDSFMSFYKANINDWCINIRGKFKNDVKKFFEKNLSCENLNVFFLESEEGWCSDSLEILKKVKSKIIFFWIEDHICIKDVDKINAIVDEMVLNEIDHLIYTFFHEGIFIDPLKAIEHKQKENVYFFNYDKRNYENLKNWYIEKKIDPHYLVSACSFISYDLFKRNLTISKKSSKYNKMLPFNFEKNFYKKEIIPFVNGVLKEELFVSIDDNHGQEGYCLIDRKLYPDRVSKKELDTIRKTNTSIYGNKEGILKKIFKRFRKNI